MLLTHTFLPDLSEEIEEVIYLYIESYDYCKLISPISDNDLYHSLSHGRPINYKNVKDELEFVRNV